MKKPLHVRVAEALGWSLSTDRKSWISPEGGRWAALGGECHIDPIPAYDTDWSATGQLIEKYGIWIHPSTAYLGMWEAGSEKHPASTYQDYSPLLAVCNFILAMAEAGKLEAT